MAESGTREVGGGWGLQDPYVRLNVAGKGIESALGKGSSFVSVSF